jgi:predicted RNA methylase
MARLQKTDVVYDLGCGDGRIVVQAAKKRGARGVGFEIVPALVKEAQANAKKNKVDHLVEIRREDLFHVDFSEATVVPMYLLPGMIEKLLPKLETLRAGTRIVAHDYPPEGFLPDKVVTVVSKETNVRHVLYLFTLPLKKAN